MAAMQYTKEGRHYQDNYCAIKYETVCDYEEQLGKE